MLFRVFHTNEKNGKAPLNLQLLFNRLIIKMEGKFNVKPLLHRMIHAGRFSGGYD
jgi:hypothetical protein